MIFAKIAKLTNLPAYPQRSRDNYKKANFLLHFQYQNHKAYLSVRISRRWRKARVMGYSSSRVSTSSNSVFRPCRWIPGKKQGNLKSGRRVFNASFRKWASCHKWREFEKWIDRAVVQASIKRSHCPNQNETVFTWCWLCRRSWAPKIGKKDRKLFLVAFQR